MSTPFPIPPTKPEGSTSTNFEDIQTKNSKTTCGEKANKDSKSNNWNQISINSSRE